MKYDPFEISLICWFSAQETFIFIRHVESHCAV